MGVLKKSKEGGAPAATKPGHVREIEFSPSEHALLLQIEKIVDAEIKRQNAGQGGSEKFRARIPREDAAEDEERACSEHFTSERIRKEAARRYNAAGWNASFILSEGAYYLDLA